MMHSTEIENTRERVCVCRGLRMEAWGIPILRAAGQEESIRGDQGRVGSRQDDSERSVSEAGVTVLSTLEILEYKLNSSGLCYLSLVLFGPGLTVQSVALLVSHA